MSGKLTLVLGCMKSGKSAELIARAEPFKIALKDVRFIKPRIDVRNNGVQSRIGAQVHAQSVDSLSEAGGADVYAVDEFHLYSADSYNYVKRWLDNGAEVIIASLDTTYDGKAFPSIVNLLCLKPDEIVLKKAVCDLCLKYNAKYTQILLDGVPQTKDLPDNLVEDGRYEYEARCRNCFIN